MRFLTDQLPLVIVTPKTGSTGAFDTWLTNQLPIPEYAAAAGGTTHSAAGISAGVSAVSAAADVTRGAAGISAGVSSVSGAALVKRTVSGVSAGCEQRRRRRWTSRAGWQAQVRA